MSAKDPRSHAPNDFGCTINNALPYLFFIFFLSGCAYPNSPALSEADTQNSATTILDASPSGRGTGGLRPSLLDVEDRSTPYPGTHPPYPLQTERALSGGPAKTFAPLTVASALYRWNDNGTPLTLIKISIAEQTARFFVGEKEVGWSRVATGRADSPTPTGVFRITEKAPDKRSNLYGWVVDVDGRVIRDNAKPSDAGAGERFEGAHMPFWMRLTADGVGLHAGLLPSPGYASSHGCIRLPSGIAETIYNNAPSGTEVVIY